MESGIYKTAVHVNYKMATLTGMINQSPGNRKDMDANLIILRLQLQKPLLLNEIR